MNRRRPSRIAALADATPASRDRYVDFLRAASIGLVVLGHWLVATVIDVDGDREATNALADLPALRPLTWVFQVMPVFFVVGGFANYQALHRPGADAGAFLASRLDRLLRPTLVFVSVWIPLAAALVAWRDDALVHDVIRVAAQPLWFLAVFLGIALLAPVQIRLHPHGTPWVLAVSTAAVVLFDVLRINEIAEPLAVVNYLAVFVIAQQLGFLYADGTLLRVPPRTAVITGAVALGVLTLLTTAGPYPVSMVGVPGDDISNMSPPTICIVVLTVAQGAFLLAVRPRLRPRLDRPRVWRATIAMNLVVMTVFLWHLSAYVFGGALLIALGMPTPDVGTVAWWLEKPVWVAVAAVVLSPIVLALSPVERMRLPRPEPPVAVWPRILGALLALRGLAGFALSGFAHVFDASGRPLLGTTLSPLADLALLVAGWLLARPRSRRSHRRSGP